MAADTCPEVANQILNVSSVYRLENACDLLANTRDGLSNYTNGFKIDCSSYEDDLSLGICNRLNADDNATKLLGTAIYNASVTQAQQCENCLQALPRPNGTTAAFASTSSAYFASPKKKSRGLLQAPGCSGTAPCFAACSDCQRYSAICSPSGSNGVAGACGLVGVGIGGVIRLFVADALCAAGGTVCTAGAPACIATCITVVTGAAGVVAGTACRAPPISLCETVKAECDACGARTGLCDLSTSFCCFGETGTQCGEGCCCCPVCEAPGGPNCECMPAPC